jgi:6-phosphofructokinase 1
MTTQTTKRIGILTSGGDCAGLNACIRAITRHALLSYGWEVFGIRKGTTGLISRPLDVEPLTLEEYTQSYMLRSGGTFLGSTNRHDPFAFPDDNGHTKDCSMDFVQGYKDLGLDALIGIGGDGSLQILRRLAQLGGLNLIGIPKTIDNDLGHTEISIGYSTALEVAAEALDRLQPTAASHQRVMILEVMGRDAGHIALGAGIAGGADIILIPEIPYKMEEICERIRNLSKTERSFALIIVAESVKKEDGASSKVLYQQNQERYGGIGHYLGEHIGHLTGAEVRVTVLGHVQRGGQPCASDRIIASAFGVKAVDLIAERKFDRMVAWRHREVMDIPILDAINQYQAVNPDDVLVKTAKSLGIYVGEV